MGSSCSGSCSVGRDGCGLAIGDREESVQLWAGRGEHGLSHPVGTLQGLGAASGACILDSTLESRSGRAMGTQCERIWDEP